MHPTTLCRPVRRSPGFSLSLLTQSTTSASHFSESHSSTSGGSVPEDVSTACVGALLSSLTAGGCVPQALQAHTLIMMAASPEDVSRVKIGSLSAGAVQMLRDLESVWGVRFLIRRVEAPAPEAGTGNGRAESEESSEEEDSEDEDDEEGLAARKSALRTNKVKPSAHQAADEFILSCRGVGVRGHRKAT